MIELSRKIANLFLRTGDGSLELTPLKERYKQFRVSLLIAISIIALIPSSMLAVLGYFRYLDLAHKQSANQILWHRQFMVDHLGEHLHALKDLAGKTASQLLPIHFESRDHLQILLDSMQVEEKSLKYIELLNLQGKSIISTSDYFLSSDQIADAGWFRQAADSGFGISGIETAPIPHFILATKTSSETQSERLICKFVFLAESLEEEINKINANAMEDVFLINRDMILQSTSHYFGDIGNPIDIPTSSFKPDITTVTRIWGMGQLFYASAPVAETPWSVVLIKDGPLYKKDWLSFQLSLVLIFIACAAFSYVIIHQLVNLLTIRIRESDTKRMALLNEVGHTNRLASIGKLAAGVAHEINNPLAVIDQKAGLVSDILEITEDFSNKEKIMNSLKGIHTNVDRCKIITHRLLGFARKMDSVQEQLDINDIIKEVIGFLEKEALFSHIFFDMHLESGLPNILSDRGQLQQIFLNIISNGIDAIKNNGKIRITTSKTERNNIRVKIEDNGPGIAPDVMEHIFDPFFTTKKTGEGTGLGLSITYGLVKNLGGDIKVESVVDKGTIFYIFLPATPPDKKE